MAAFFFPRHALLNERLSSKPGPALVFAVTLACLFAPGEGSTKDDSRAAPAKQNQFRSAVDQPFNSQSFWNIPLGRGARYQPASAPESSMLHDESVGGHAFSFSWIGANALRIYQQKASDPVLRWTYESRASTLPWPHSGDVANGSFDMPTPPDMTFSGDDRYVVLLTADGRHAYEVWLGSFDAATRSYHARYLVRTDLYGLGAPRKDGVSEGIRAFGGSLLGGLLRCRELERRSIPHAIAMIPSPTQMKRGATMGEQKVWPATVTDNGGANDYSGLIPMGALFAIPPSVDLAKLGLSPEGFALATAFQQFGGYVVDSATRTNMLTALETGCPQAAIDHLNDDKLKILNQLVMVLNNSASAPGGPGPRIAPAPPPLAGE